MDFFCHEARLVIEVDGGIHGTEEKRQTDALRRRVFAARGLAEMRFTNEEVTDGLGSVLDRIDEYVRSMRSAAGMQRSP